MDRRKVITAHFYASSSGKMPVREWLLSLAKEDRIEIGGDIANVEYHWPVGPPRCKPIGNEIFEIRSRISNNRAARVLFFIDSDQLYLLHGFIKKSKKLRNDISNWPKKEKQKWRDKGCLRNIM